MEAPLMHLALVGTPNSGKTSLFNALTGSRQKVANYPGVTVERKEGIVRHARRAARSRWSTCPAPIRCAAAAPTRRSRATWCSAARPGEAPPDLVLCVADSTNLRLTIRLRARAQAHRPAADAGAQHVRHRHAPRRHASTCARLSEALGVPVVTSIAVRKGGIAELLRRTDEIAAQAPAPVAAKSLAAAHRRRAARHPARGRPHHRRHRQPAGEARHLDRRGSTPWCCIRWRGWRSWR